MISFLDATRMLRIPGNDRPNQPRVVRVEMTDRALAVFVAQVKECEAVNHDVRGWSASPVGSMFGIPIVAALGYTVARSSPYAWRAVDADGDIVAQGTLRPDRWTLEAGR